MGARLPAWFTGLPTGPQGPIWNRTTWQGRRGPIGEVPPSSADVFNPSAESTSAASPLPFAISLLPHLCCVKPSLSHTDTQTNTHTYTCTNVHTQTHKHTHMHTHTQAHIPNHEWGAFIRRKASLHCYLRQLRTSLLLNIG